MKILCIADVHGDEKRMARFLGIAAGADLVAIGGDLLDGWEQDPTEQIERWQEWITKCQKPVVFCEGNHDSNLQTLTGPNGPIAYRGTFIAEACGEQLLVTAIPWEAQDEQILWEQGSRHHKASKLPWLVLRHDPPSACALSEPTTGSAEARRSIIHFEPDFFLCGHIHSAPWSSKTCWCKLGKTIGINPGNNEALLSYAILDTRLKKVDWVQDPV